MLGILEKNGNHMPLTFIIIPSIDYKELPTDAKLKEKLLNFAKRKKKVVSRLLWDKSLIVFICPVTQKQVRECEAILFAFFTNRHFQVVTRSFLCPLCVRSYVARTATATRSILLLNWPRS